MINIIVFKASKYKNILIILFFFNSILSIHLILINYIMSLRINEIFYSIQGESSLSGLPCIFIRLTYCNLRCTWCDTEYSFYEGKNMKIGEILTEIKKYNCKLVEVTGGEPLLQKESFKLMESFISCGYKVMLETGGSLSVKQVPKEVVKIIDFKCPFSEMNKKNLWSILDDMEDHDEIKFVIGNREDYEWAKNKIKKYNLTEKWIVLFSCVFNELSYGKLAKWILDDALNVKFQVQMHKHIWDPNTIGV